LDIVEVEIADGDIDESDDVVGETGEDEVESSVRSSRLLSKV
jgi:hypothetical protein